MNLVLKIKEKLTIDNRPFTTVGQCYLDYLNDLGIIPFDSITEPIEKELEKEYGTNWENVRLVENRKNIIEKIVDFFSQGK